MLSMSHDSMFLDLIILNCGFTRKVNCGFLQTKTMVVRIKHFSSQKSDFISLTLLITDKYSQASAVKGASAYLNERPLTVNSTFHLDFEIFEYQPSASGLKEILTGQKNTFCTFFSVQKGYVNLRYRVGHKELNFIITTVRILFRIYAVLCHYTWCFSYAILFNFS